MNKEQKQKFIDTVFNNSSIKDFRVEREKVLESWQFIESIDLSCVHRFELDKEAYLNHYFNTPYPIAAEFEEKVLVKKLIKNLKKAKHPVWIHYREYLKMCFKNIKQSEESITEENYIPHQIKTYSKLTINQIALRCVYEELQITRENGDQIAKENGHNSGEKLFQRFTFYSSKTNRKAKPNPFTQRKLENKINLLESVIELIPIDKQNKAKDEVSILKIILDTLD